MMSNTPMACLHRLLQTHYEERLRRREIPEGQQEGDDSQAVCLSWLSGMCEMEIPELVLGTAMRMARTDAGVEEVQVVWACASKVEGKKAASDALVASELV